MEMKTEVKYEPPKEIRPGYCPNCGAYVGAFYSCYWCRAKMPHGTKLRAVQIFSVVAVIVEHLAS